MSLLKRVTFSVVALTFMSFLPSEKALAACNATVNGRPMSHQECAMLIQIYGQVIPGNYWADDNGNWVNIHNPQHRGNIYRDVQRHNENGGSWGGDSLVSPRGVYDPTGGCEGGSCVNIID